eukprot:1336714-Pyramimonas_sp.AAC.1
MCLGLQKLLVGWPSAQLALPLLLGHGAADVQCAFRKHPVICPSGNHRGRVATGRRHVLFD